MGLVTGGASGLGEGVVRMLVGAGARALIVDLPTSAGAQLARELGQDAHFVGADVTVPDQVRGAVAEAVARYGRLDVTVNCAGISPSHRVLASDGSPYPLDAFRRAVDVNLVGLFDVVRWSAHHMARNEPGADGERGLVVNVASIAGCEGQVGQAAYTASKGAVLALTLQLARDLERSGIRVLAIAPGMMDTPMLSGVPDDYRGRLAALHVFPKRLGRADELAKLVRTFMELTLMNGEVVRLDAGARLPPSS
ncbi:MAG: 3-hydroxyacyl-CoA dehydrogenase [Conexibacter sp.]|nr:3-hydroxyacyl-CoA dehydrogenase [Conexibacter sp.]